ncbi:uncharacterized protein JCM6883_006936 [Sporobolomyces salmoneus]|uniref:uncharacterized protein n=1 Tax=Sporobolomyces salmoneus TaxID=183962 RepID=UPI003182A730
MVNSSPNRSLLPLSSLPSLLLERTSDGALFPGSTFSFAISLPSFRPPSSPLSVELTFTGSTARYGSAPSTEHLLFRLSSSIDLKASKWNGVITILLSSTCCTCHTRNDVLPQSFSHREADGRKYETSYVIVANCEEFEEARLEIEVGSRSQGSERRDEGTATGSEVEGFIEGWQLDLTHSEMRFRYDLDDSKSTPDFSPYPVLRISSKFRFLSTANEPDYETLLLAFSPAQFSVFPQALIHSSRSAEVSRTRMVFSNRLDDFELTVRSLNLEEHQAVEVLREWVIDAEAMDLAPFTSCAGFSVSFELTVELGRTSSSAGLRFGVPFASSSPSPPSSRAQTGLTDAASTNTSVDTGDLSGVGGAGDVVTEAEIAERESGKNAARRRWNRLRRIFLATKAISGRS